MAKPILILFGMMILSACTNGGSLQMEPGAVKIRDAGSPYVFVNSGGQALVVEQGKTASTGVHGWVSVQPVSATSMSGGSGITAVIHQTRNPASH